MSRDAALNLAKKGFKVFRLDGKIPVAGFLAEATCDPTRIADLWDDLSSDWNVGILCDELLVLDFDVKDGLPGTSEYLQAKVTYCDEDACVVKTPSGGFHLYFRLPAGVRLANSSKKIGKATDTRSWHGYVAGPGSQGYVWHQGREPDHLIDLPLAPPELIALCEKAPDAKADGIGNTDVKLDTKAAITAAIDYLERHAPGATIGSRDSTAYRVAAKVRDFGISEARCADLLLGHWNETKVEPPLEPNKIEEDVNHAYRYAQNPIGGDLPGVEFSPAYIPPDARPKLDPDWPKFEPFEMPDEADIPPREWIVKGILARGYVTALVAPSGSGKTQWLAQLSLAIASGRGEVAGVEIVEKHARTWVWNQEDDKGELARRVRASATFFGLGKQETAGLVGISSGVERALNLVVRDPESGFLRRTIYVERLVRQIIEQQIAVFIVDPLTEFHEANENDNTEMRFVMAALRYIATRTRCAVLIGHHTKKPDTASSDGFAGNANSGRGASSLQGVTRVMLTLYSMSDKDAKDFGVPREERPGYVRLDGAKSNISQVAGGTRPDWFRWQSHHMVNGESIGVLEKADLTRIKSRVVRTGDTTVDITTYLAGQEAKVQSWKTVAAAIGLNDSQAKRWMAQAPDVVETNLGKFKINRSSGRAGTQLEWIG